MDKELFREEAMKNMFTPESLNESIYIGDTKSWALLIGIGIMLATFIIWAFVANIVETVNLNGVIFPEKGIQTIRIPQEGRVTDVRVEVGDKVGVGDVLMIIPQQNILDKEVITQDDLKKYESYSIIKSNVNGRIIELVDKGIYLQEGEVVAKIIEEDIYSNTKEVKAYVPAVLGRKLKEGMEAQVSPDYAAREEYGFMQGFITSIGTYPITREQVIQSYGGLLTQPELFEEESYIEVRITLSVDSESKNLLKWSNERGESLDVNIGTNCKISTIVSQKKPIDWLWSK